MARKKQQVATVEQGSNLPIPYEQRMRAQAAEAAKMEAGDSNFITVRGGVLSWMGESMPNNEMRVVILGGVGEHTYYDTPYDADRIVPPTCFSVFEMLGESPHPHEDVPPDQRQDDGNGCKACELHAFKSAPNGKGRACAVKRRLLVMPEAGLEDDDQAATAILKVSPTSVQNWSKYVQMVAAKHQRPPFMVVTRVWTEPHPNWQFTINFEVAGLIEEELYDDLNQMAEVGLETLLQPFDMSGGDDEPPAPKRKLKETKPAARRTTSKKTARKR